MTPKTDFDPMLPADLRRRRWPIVAIGTATIGLALGGLALRAGPIPSRRPGSPIPRVAPVPRPRDGGRGKLANPRVAKVRPRDPFLIVAPADIDPAMVLRAREDIDPEMVFHPETGRRGPSPNVPAPVPVPPR